MFLPHFVRTVLRPCWDGQSCHDVLSIAGPLGRHQLLCQAAAVTRHVMRDAIDRICNFAAEAEEASIGGMWHCD